MFQLFHVIPMKNAVTCSNYLTIPMISPDWPLVQLIFAGEVGRSFILLFLLTMLTFFDVMAGYRYSQGITTSGTWTGMTAVTLQMSLLTYLDAGDRRLFHAVPMAGDPRKQNTKVGLPAFAYPTMPV